MFLGKGPVPHLKAIRTSAVATRIDQ